MRTWKLALLPRILAVGRAPAQADPAPSDAARGRRMEKEWGEVSIFGWVVIGLAVPLLARLVAARSINPPTMGRTSARQHRREAAWGPDSRTEPAGLTHPVSREEASPAALMSMSDPDIVDLASMGSFPASDPPPWTLGREPRR